MKITIKNLKRFIDENFSNPSEWKNGENTVLEFERYGLAIMDGNAIYEEYSEDELAVKSNKELLEDLLTKYQDDGVLQGFSYKEDTNEEPYCIDMTIDNKWIRLHNSSNGNFNAFANISIDGDFNDLYKQLETVLENHESIFNEINKGYYTKKFENNNFKMDDFKLSNQQESKPNSQSRGGQR